MTAKTTPMSDLIANVCMFCLIMFCLIICLIIHLFIYYYYMKDYPTLEQCNRTFDLDENFDFYQCKCFRDLRICKISLVILQKCKSTSPAKVFRNETNCEMMYSECSTADKYSCKAGMCECLKEREMDHPEIVLEIESEMEDEIESAPQNHINQPPEIEQQQQTNNSIITASTPLTSNDSNGDSSDQKKSSGSRKFYYLLLLFVIYYYLYDSPTLEECNRTFELDENFDFYQCKCVQDLRICKISLVILQTCNTTSPAKYLETKQIVKCCILNALLLINIVVKLECVNALKVRSIGVVAVFTEIILGDLGEYFMWN
uniref:Uncharacterized protein n=2 Tax=Meloidogyne TaxID=189290 RepID=A0A914LL56_MELIC